MTAQPNDPQQQPDDPLSQRDPLWDALGRAPMRRPDPWFAARTLARARRQVPAAPARSGWLRWMWAPALALAVLFCGLWLGDAPVPTASVAVTAPAPVAEEGAPARAEDLHQAFAFLATSDEGTEEEIWVVTTTL